MQRRDPAADGSFVYSVASTGVYCRPSCPSRQPHRKNVEFHADPAAAEAAGFRACMRCHPKGPSLAERQAALIEAACRQIEMADEMPSLAVLAAADCDMGLVAYEMALLVERVGRALTPDMRGVLRPEGSR